jgi:hypothetical protein
LDQEKAEVHEELRQKLAEIMEMQKEVEEKSKLLAEKAKQNKALLVQLKKSRFFIKWGINSASLIEQIIKGDFS